MRAISSMNNDGPEEGKGLEIILRYLYYFVTIIIHRVRMNAIEKWSVASVRGNRRFLYYKLENLE